MLRWVINAQMAQEMKLTAESGAKKSTLRLEMPFDERISNIAVTVLNSEGEAFESAFTMTAPGIYEGEIGRGSMLQICPFQREKRRSITIPGFVLCYPLEYDMTRKGEGAFLLQQIVSVGGGRILENGSRVLEAEPLPVVSQKDLSVWFMVLGLLLFLLDVAFRRFLFLVLCMEGIAFAKGHKSKAITESKQKPIRSDLKQKDFENPPLKTEKEKAPQNTVRANTAEKLTAAKKKRGN